MTWQLHQEPLGTSFPLVAELPLVAAEGASPGEFLVAHRARHREALMDCPLVVPEGVPPPVTQATLLTLEGSGGVPPL